MLDKRPLGNTGLALSIIGLGTVKLGRNQAVKYPHSFTIPDDSQMSNLLNVASEQGVNLLDTAPAYGRSEERLGKLLVGQRQKWVICTKAGEEYAAGRSQFDFSPRHTRYSIERSLKRLKTDYIDIVLVHSDGNDMEIINHEGTLETLENLKTEGKLRAFGMSTKTLEGGLAAAALSDCVMVTWNLYQQEEKAVIDQCLRLRKGVLIKKALASGHIGKENDGNSIVRSLDLLFSHPGVTSAVIGTIDPDHLRSNISMALQVTRNTL